jgi:DNA-binding transcriptional MerR regulator
VRIGELAAELGLNPKTIRYYEEVGLLPEPPRTPAGYRLYAAADRERLSFILKARAVGLTLDEISAILAVRRMGQPPCEHVLGLLDRKIAGIDQQLRALRDVRQELVGLRQDADISLCADGSVCGIIERHALQRLEQTTPAGLGTQAGHRVRRRHRMRGQSDGVGDAGPVPHSRGAE